MKLKELFAKCMSDVDFNKIQRVMELLDWRWYGEKDCPSIAQMKEMCERLFISAKSDYKLNKVYSRRSSGWFEVVVDKWYVSIRFILDDNEYGRDC